MSRNLDFGTNACGPSETGYAKCERDGRSPGAVGPLGGEIPESCSEEIVFTPEDLDAHRTYLLKVANRILKPELRPRVSASDLVQESVIVAIRKFRSFQGQSLSHLRRWLTRILKNRYGNHHRAHYGAVGNRKNLVVSLESLHTDTKNWEIPTEENSASAERIREQLDQVRAELARLSAGEAEVFMLVMEHHLSMPEIARRLGITEATARKRYERALKRLKKRLKPVAD